MNMPKQMTKNNYNEHVNSLCTAISQVAEDTMMDAAKEIIKMAGTEDIVDTSISCYGSW